MNAELERTSSRTKREIFEVADFRCPDDKKLLNRTLLRVKNVSLSDEDFDKFLKGTEISNGAQCKCRTCKKIRQVETPLTVAA